MDSSDLAVIAMDSVAMAILFWAAARYPDRKCYWAAFSFLALLAVARLVLTYGFHMEEIHQAWIKLVAAGIIAFFVYRKFRLTDGQQADPEK